MSNRDRLRRFRQKIRLWLGDDRQSRLDQAFMPASAAASYAAASRFGILMSVLTTAIFVLFLLWASIVKIDEVTRGQGQIIPSSKVQVIQNLEGGILREVMVREGEIVDKNAVLLRIDNELAESTLREMQSRTNTLHAKEARLLAESKGRKDITFPDNISDTLKAQEQAQFMARQQQQRSQNQVLQSQARQKRREVGELQSSLRGLQRSLSIAQEEEALNADLFQQGVVSRVDFLQSKRKATDIRSEIGTIRVSISRANAGLQESQQRVAESQDRFRAEAATELADVQAELASLKETITAGKDRVTRTEVRAPVRSSVKTIHSTTIGGVIKPGADIVELVPVDDKLEVEARIRPADIAFLSIGQPARIKVTAYDFSIYGGLDAEVKNISTDTLEDERGNFYYLVRLQTKQSALIHNDKALDLIPGMTATAEILTGRKSILHYLLKPILKVRDTALTER